MYKALKNQNVLLFTRTMMLGGTENVVLQLCEILKPVVNKVVVCSCGGVNVEKLDAMGIQHHTIADIERKSPGVILETLATLKRIIEEENITVIHTHHRMAALYAQLLRPLHPFTLLCSVHGEFYDKIQLTRFCYRKATVVACGNMVKENLMTQFHIPEATIAVVRNAVARDTSRLVPIPELMEKVAEDKLLLGYIGRLSEEKGVRYLMEAIPQVLQHRQDVHVIIVGTGYQQEMLENMARNLDIVPYISFLGFREDAQNVIRQLDAVVLPSLTEGLPLTPIEAFAQGVPVVATAVGGTVEIVEDHVNGLLVAPKNPTALAKAMLELCSTPTLRTALAEKATETFERSYSFQEMRRNVLTLYSQIPHK